MAVGKGRLAIQARPGEGTRAAGAKKILAAPVSVHGATHHRNRGRQGAVDKKRGRNPVKETASVPAHRPGTIAAENPPGQPDCLSPLKIKNPNSLKGGIEDCTRLAWSSSRRPARVTRALSVYPTGRSSGSWINLLPAPSRGILHPSGFSRFRPQLQRRDRDGFAPSSLIPVIFLIYPVLPRESRASAPRSNTKVLTSTPRAWATGPHLAWRRNQTLGSPR
jgi:hypothetical protein